MHALPFAASKLAIATALALTCAAGLSTPAHADRGRSWDGPRHGAFQHHDRRHGYERHHRFNHRPSHGRFSGPRHYARPHYHAHSHLAPLFGRSIVFRSGPVIAAPALPTPRIYVPAPLYGVRELGPAR